MTRAEDDEQVRVAPLSHLAVRPGVGRPPPVEVDVGSDDPVEPGVFLRGSGWPGSVRIVEEPGDLLAECVGLGSVGAPGMNRGTGGACPERLLGRLAAAGELRTVEETLLVQRPANLLQALSE